MQSSSKTTIVLMPGLNGTAGSFQDFATIAPAAHEVIAFTYPTDTALNYEELTDWVLERLSCLEGPIVLIGESFSGPLSLFVASRLQQNVVAVILVASFVQPPKSALFKLLPWQTGFSLTRPLYALRVRSRTINYPFVE
ncbi:hypothetical protein IGB42_00254 [Andreprevotia sp. IGB-42]|uniref:alpha/beta fold hydrolase n=1 Tax=Andreprevotia sp. IGB-42 TaxID=2497473 RepID=UPI00135A7CD3|nr:alpha/beta fold hydrolase [Andreprevotia sp. IGB-42]KAF0815177.1 hypothetical protein IGB42_00254 [Andreprevotia sp. IGB-42]